MRTAIPLPLDQLAEFSRRWKITRLEVFGSILRDDFGPDSDVDFLVTYAPDANWSFATEDEARAELEAIVGRRVDIVPRSAVERSDNWLRRRYILDGAQSVYAA